MDEAYGRLNKAYGDEVVAEAYISVDEAYLWYMKRVVDEAYGCLFYLLF